MDGMMLLAMMMSISPNSTLCLFNRHATVTVVRRRQPEDSCTETVCKVLNLEAPSHLSREILSIYQSPGFNPNSCTQSHQRGQDELIDHLPIACSPRTFLAQLVLGVINTPGQCSRLLLQVHSFESGQALQTCLGSSYTDRRSADDYIIC